MGQKKNVVKERITQNLFSPQPSFVWPNKPCVSFFVWVVFSLSNFLQPLGTLQFSCLSEEGNTLAWESSGFSTWLASKMWGWTDWWGKCCGCCFFGIFVGVFFDLWIFFVFVYLGLLWDHLTKPKSANNDSFWVNTCLLYLH